VGKIKNSTLENKECPFCTSELLVVDCVTELIYGEYIESYYVTCDTCHSRGGMSESELGAWTLWNTRGRMSPLCPQEH